MVGEAGNHSKMKQRKTIAWKKQIASSDYFRLSRYVLDTSVTGVERCQGTSLTGRGLK